VFCAFGVTHVGYYSFDGSTGTALSPPRWWLARITFHLIGKPEDDRRCFVAMVASPHSGARVHTPDFYKWLDVAGATEGGTTVSSREPAR